MINLEDCWLYAGYKNPEGYGAIAYKLDSGKWKSAAAHRVSYETFTGPIPEGLCIDHLCSVRCCINPDHLEAVTLRENTLRGKGVQEKRSRTHCPRKHEYSLENTLRGYRGERICKICTRAAKKIYNQKYYLRNKDRFKYGLWGDRSPEK